FNAQSSSNGNISNSNVSSSGIPHVSTAMSNKRKLSATGDSERPTKEIKLILSPPKPLSTDSPSPSPISSAASTSSSSSKKKKHNSQEESDNDNGKLIKKRK
ncbi:hypothetical protein MBANPS3_012527, partial [Mucor bainieri]